MIAFRRNVLRSLSALSIALPAISGMALLGFTSTAQATIISFQEGVGVPAYVGTQDTFIHSTFNPGLDRSADPVGVLMDAADAGGFAQGLLRFDSIIGGGVNQIPLGSTINSATLTLTDVVGGGGTAASTNVHRMQITWPESANYTGNFGGNGVQPGVLLTDEALSPADTIVPAHGAGAVVSVSVLSSVTAWASGTPNYGWVLINTGGDGWRFRVSEDADTSVRPLLTVDFTAPPPPVPEPSTYALGLLGLAGLTVVAYRRRRQRA